MPLIALITAMCVLAIVSAVSVTIAMHASSTKARELKMLSENFQSKLDTTEQLASLRTKDEMQKLLMDAEIRAQVSTATQELKDRHFEEQLVAKVEGARAIAASLARQELLDSFHPEIRHYRSVRGKLWKTHFVVIEERLLLGQLPVTGWFKHEIQVNETLDERELKALAEAAAILIKATVPTAPKLPSLKDVGRVLLDQIAPDNGENQDSQLADNQKTVSDKETQKLASE